MKCNISLVALVLAASALSGCQSFFGIAGHSQSREKLSSADVDLSDYFAERVAAGKAQLDRGQYGAALAAFRQARYHPEFAGEAYNGMAIVYARLGREDLAEGFFIEAGRADPANTQFAANLSRFYDHSRHAAKLQKHADERKALLATEQTPDNIINSSRTLTTSRAVIRIALPETRLMRSSAGQVQLATIAGSGKGTPREAKDARRAPVRIVTQTAPAAYPIRNKIPGRPATVHITTWPKADRKPAYPVRVAITK